MMEGLTPGWSRELEYMMSLGTGELEKHQEETVIRRGSHSHVGSLAVGPNSQILMVLSLMDSS